MSVYIVASIAVRDWEEYGKYQAGFLDIFTKYRGELLAVSDEPQKAKKFLGSERFPLLFDPDWEVAHRFKTEKLPETHVVVQGKVVESFIGASEWLNRDVQGRVLRYLSGRN